jgi:hypothetical protein
MADEMEVKHYFQLEFGTNKEGETELKLKGPEIPGSESSPTIAFHKKDGKFVFEIGVEIHEVDANELSDDLKSYVNEARRADGRIGPWPVAMPPKNKVCRADGTFKTYEDFKRDTIIGLNTAAVRNPKSKNPLVPRPLYEALVQYYRTHDKYGNPMFL